ncbi:MFS transporter [Brevundimonas sp.]|uniref:MFS transporter n=1 Tax=Brevundimonas sp. TaxID=1871086 RepID=UPI003BAD6564
MIASLDQATGSQRRSWRYLLLYALAYGGGVIAYVPLLSLLLPLKVEEIAMADKVALLSLTTLAGAVAASVTNILAGMLSDRSVARGKGRRGWVLGGMVATLVSFVGLRLCDSPASLVLAIIVFQVALNVMLGPLVAIAADEVPDDQKGVMGGLLGSAYPLGSIAAILITATPGLTETTQLMVVGALVSAGLLPFLILLRPMRVSEGAIVALSAPQPRAVGRRNLALVWAARLLVQMAGIILFAFFLFYFESVDHSGAVSDTRKLAGRIAWLSGLVTVLTVPLSILIGRASDRIGKRKPFLIWTAGIAVLGLVIMAAFPRWTPAATGYVMFSCASGVFLALQAAYAMQLLPAPGHRGRDLGILNLANTGPAILGPTLTFAVVTAYGFGPLILTLAALTAAAGGLTLLVRDDAKSA